MCGSVRIQTFIQFNPKNKSSAPSTAHSSGWWLSRKVHFSVKMGGWEVCGGGVGVWGGIERSSYQGSLYKLPNQ